MAKPEVSTIGKYRVLERIATGDLAEIYKARLEGIAGFRRLFAIKRVRPHLARLDTYAAMIEEESRIAGLLSHGNIVQLLDLGREDGVLYLVMEYVDGWDLGKVLERCKELEQPAPMDQAVWIGLQLLKGLEYAHNREVIRNGEKVGLDLVHRDVSPSNILLSRQGDVKLTDFGIARASLKMMQTHPDLVRRRFDYMSPEQARSSEITQAADLFAVAVVMYECLTLTHPFRREGEFATLEAIRDGDHVPIGELRDDLPDALVTVIERALSPDVSERPADATEFKNILSEILEVTGEVFTQETLGSWLGEIIVEEPEPEPEPESPRRAESLSDIGGPDVTELSDLPDGPDDTLPAPLVVDGDAFGEDPATVVVTREKAAEWGTEEKATVVNRNVAARLAALRREKDAEAAVGNFEQEDATRVRRPSSLPQLDEPQPKSSLGNETILAGVMSAVLMLAIGAVLGAAMVSAYERSGGMLVNPPMLDVRSAPNVKMQVTVDGQSIQGPRRVSAGSHRLRVDVEGSQPWEVDLTLEAGEYRLMMIEAHETVPEAPDTPGDDG